MSKDLEKNKVTKKTSAASAKNRAGSAKKATKKKNNVVKSTTKTSSAATKEKTQIFKDKTNIIVSFQSLQQNCAIFRMFHGKKIRINGFRPGKEPWVLIYGQARDEINYYAVHSGLMSELEKNHKDRKLKEMDFRIISQGEKKGDAFIAEVTYKYSKKTEKGKN
jgi:hypothetical protein